MTDAIRDRAAKGSEPKVQLCWHCLNPVTNHIRGCVMALEHVSLSVLDDSADWERESIGGGA